LTIFNMVNLLSIQEKKYLQWEYRCRLFVLVLKGIFVLAAIFIILLLPTRARLMFSERADDKRIEVLGAGQASSLEREVRASVLDINQKLSIFTFKPEWVFSQEVLDPILNNLGSNIQLKSVFLERSPTGVVAKLRGWAADREKLLEFRRRLETVSGFAQVDLPISNFVKGRDIEFSLDILLSEKK